MDGFDITRSGDFSDSLNNLNNFIQKKAREEAEKLKKDENSQIQDFIAFKNSQKSIIERIKKDASLAKSLAPAISSRIKSYAKSPKTNTGASKTDSKPIQQKNIAPAAPRTDMGAAQRLVDSRKEAVMRSVSRLTPFRQQVFGVLLSGAKRDYGINRISKDLTVFQQVRALYRVGDFSIEEYENFYNISASILDLQDPNKASYFIELLGKAAKRQGAGVTLPMVKSIMNIALTSNPVGFKSPEKKVGTEPKITRLDLEKISDEQLKKFYEKMIFRARPLGGGKFGVVISDGERKATVFNIAASDQKQYRQTMQDRYLSQLAFKLRRTIKPLLSSSTSEFKELQKRINEERRRND